MFAFLLFIVALSYIAAFVQPKYGRDVLSRSADTMMESGSTEMISDFIIALSYFAIPLELAYFAALAGEEIVVSVGVSLVVCLFFSFILLCGITHLLNMLGMFFNTGLYLVIFKVLTAIVSVATASICIYLVPRIIRTKQEFDKFSTRLEILSKLNESSSRVRESLMKADVYKTLAKETTKWFGLAAVCVRRLSETHVCKSSNYFCLSPVLRIHEKTIQSFVKTSCEQWNHNDVLTLTLRSSREAREQWEQEEHSEDSDGNVVVVMSEVHEIVVDYPSSDEDDDTVPLRRRSRVSGRQGGQRKITLYVRDIRVRCQLYADEKDLISFVGFALEEKDLQPFLPEDPFLIELAYQALVALRHSAMLEKETSLRNELHSALYSCIHAFVAVDAATFEILNINSSFLEMFGGDDQYDVVGKDVHTYIPLFSQYVKEELAKSASGRVFVGNVNACKFGLDGVEEFPVHLGMGKVIFDTIHVHTHIFTYTHTRIHTYMHTHIHISTHIDIHT